MSHAEMQQDRLINRPTASKTLQFAEFAAVFGVPAVILAFAGPMAADNPVAIQAVVWVANVTALLLVYAGLRLRGQTWAHFGLAIGKPRRAAVVRTLLLSIPVFVVASAAFLLATAVMANMPGVPERADMSGYNFLYHNLPMLLLSLFGVYIVSSFGEEVIYRAFLITRIEEMGGGGNAVHRFAVLVSAVVFGLVHFQWGIVGIGQTALVGLVFALAYVKLKRNLWINVLAHGYMDTILLVQLFFVQGTN